MPWMATEMSSPIPTLETDSHKTAGMPEVGGDDAADLSQDSGTVIGATRGEHGSWVTDYFQTRSEPIYLVLHPMGNRSQPPTQSLNNATNTIATSSLRRTASCSPPLLVVLAFSSPPPIVLAASSPPPRLVSNSSSPRRHVIYSSSPPRDYIAAALCSHPPRLVSTAPRCPPPRHLLQIRYCLHHRCIVLLPSLLLLSWYFGYMLVLMQLISFLIILSLTEAKRLLEEDVVLPLWMPEYFQVKTLLHKHQGHDILTKVVTKSNLEVQVQKEQVSKFPAEAFSLIQSTHSPKKHGPILKYQQDDAI
ncbi:hypothetical protein PIB30_063335 [Stylosanthes scabra]|uniref:Uncharacterized protein n=1 Tax=Stylosanthes scabra TaxID=79078 RepID=A0ABU6VKM4_9FABA|nr:hypothetical protein [Stylosanthes scabra]